MDRISQAIAKTVRASPSRPFATTAPADRTGVESIRYQQTQIVEVDDHHLEQHRIVAHNKADPRSIEFDKLRTQVTQRMAENGWRTLAVTSPTADCGKTTCAVNLAFSIAHKVDQTALLVDFDLRKPSVSRLLGFDKTLSLADYLEDKAKLRDVFVNPGYPRITILSNNRPLINASEILSSPKVSTLVQDLKSRYQSRVIIFDLPPLLTSDDTLAFLPQIDCVLLVAASGVTKKAQLEQSANLLRRMNVIGVVMNKSHAPDTQYFTGQYRGEA